MHNESPSQALSSRQHLPLIFFTLAVMILLVVPPAVQHGMFMDGTQYACVARNLAEGRGTFWFPYLSPTWHKAGSSYFLEHPPLGYYIESLFFTTFGNSVFVEKWFSVLLAAISAFLVYKTWNQFNPDKDVRRYWWLPVLLWFVTPSVFWSFRNNMLENFLCVTVLAASYFLVGSLTRSRHRRLFALTGGAFIFIGLLCKGLPALFPVAVPFVYYFVMKGARLKDVVLSTAIALAVPAAAVAGITLFSEEGRSSLLFYFEHRLLQRVETEHIVGNRLTVLFWVLTDQLPFIGIALVLFAAAGIRKAWMTIRSNGHRAPLFFLLTGLAGVLPLCFTFVQRAVYFVPAMSFFALGLASWLSPVAGMLLSRASERAAKIMTLGTAAMLAGVIVYSVAVAGGIDRDAELIRSANRIASVTGRNKVLETTSAVYNKWDFQFYLLRYHQVALGGTGILRGDTLLVPKGTPGAPVNDSAYRRVELEDYYLLFKEKP
jgi:4-amino-4-deoxy-L-arabinose transferase-like glycosyltransferase